MLRLIVVVGLLLVASGMARAQDRIILDEILGSWQGDDEVQFIELRMVDVGQNGLASVAALVFDDATASEAGRRVFALGNVATGVTNAKILIATNKLRDLAGIEPDFTLEPGRLRPRAGRVCYVVMGTFGSSSIDCVAYGLFQGDNGLFGRPTAITPDNRSLRRLQVTGKNRADWEGVLEPAPENNAGESSDSLKTLCGDGPISQGEECDGDELGGETCASRGFVKGKLRCTQCHFDTTKCTTCGNDAITGSEECDGTDLGERTCEAIGFTGGRLACTEECTFTTDGCDPIFFVPGGGPPKTDCLAEWRVVNAGGRPAGDGRALPRQTCKDGDGGCDADGTRNGICVFTVAPCFLRTDARLSRCLQGGVSSWQLLTKLDPADPLVTALAGSVAALGPSSIAGTAVAFSPALGTPNSCGADVAVQVKAGSRLALRARTAAAGGKPRDVDQLKLVCTP